MKEKKHAVSLVIHYPLSDFSNTHFLGAGFDYSPARHQFGLLKIKLLALTYTGGLEYYFGKNETVSGYDYHYRGYLFVYGMGGLLSKITKKTNLALYTGPALGIYHGHVQFNWASKAEFEYYINKKIGIVPGIFYMKESGANGLWNLSLKGIVQIPYSTSRYYQ